MQSLKSIDLSALPEWARQEVYDFFLFMKQRIEHQRVLSNVGECALLSEDSLAEDWNKSEEDEAWKNFQ